GPGGAVFTKSAPPGRRRQKLYTTGDLARWLPDGNIEFLGRLDFQVKIRGNRVELGEIENQLLHHPEVKEAVVVLKRVLKGDSPPGNPGNQFLCAYIVFGTVDTAELKQYLSRSLPDYMIPSYFVTLDRIPLTPTGKIDRQALPAPEVKPTEIYTSPRNVKEKTLVKIWSEILGIEKDTLGIDDNFFEMGGDSIKALQLAARLKKYDLEMKVNSIFKHQTIRTLAKNIEKTKREIPQDTVKGEVALTPIQEWFFESYPGSNSHFNQAVMISRETGFKEEWTRRIFEKIVSHHDALRMIFKKEEDRVVQVNSGSEGEFYHLEVINLENTDHHDIESLVEKKSSQIQGGMDLTGGPLVRLGLFKTPGGDHLLIAIHHLVIDGVSWRILLEDFSTAYQQLEKGEDIRFQDKTDSYQYWSRKLREYAQSHQVLKELNYWQEIEESNLEPLPRDREIKEEDKIFAHVQTIEMVLDKENTLRLLKQTNRAYNTETKDILVTALALALADWAGITKILIHLEGHGREGIINDVDIS
ncbi:MAG: non-ribosomal peptide synthetase, partial [Candidatus Aminicenantes bacterium]